MKLKDIKLFSYDLKFKNPISFKDNNLDSRVGFIIRISDDNGNIGLGETAPLINFSKETYESTKDELLSFTREYDNKEILSDILNRISTFSPSVRFGLESALLTLQAAKKELALSELLNPTSMQPVKLNALLNGSDDHILKLIDENKFEAYKLKIGRREIDKDILLIEDIQKRLSPDSRLRLDVNQMLDEDNAFKLLERLSPEKIEYIEEPFENLEALKKYLDSQNNNLLVALDESLVDLNPEDLNRFPRLSAIILKPTLLGFTKSMMFARKAKELNIKAVISSSFESTIGLYILASMAAVIDNGLPVGLDTASSFKESITAENLKIENGEINLKSNSNLLNSLNYDKLTGVSID